MGARVNAYLGYGVHLPDEQFDDLPWAIIEYDDEDDGSPKETKLNFKGWVTQLAGLVDPSAHIVDRDDEWEAWYKDSANAEAMSTFWRQQRQAEANFPIGVINVYTGDSGDPCIILAVKSTISVGWWGDPRPAVTTVDDTALQTAVEFCSQHNIPFENPQWLLVAEYGD